MSNTNVVTNLNADLLDGEHSSAFAHIGAHNDLIAAGNEFTFASSGQSGRVWFNYRTAGGTNGNITEYIFGNGAGASLGTAIHSGNYSSYALPLSGGTMTGTINANDGAPDTGIKFKSNNASLNALGNQHLILGSAIRFGDYNTWDWNVWAGLKYKASSKTIYLGLADGTTFSANEPQSGGTLKFPGVSELYMNADARISYAEAGDLYIGRADNSGYLYFQDMASQSGTEYWNLTQDGHLTAKSVGAGYIELSHSTPYIDFHYGNSTSDYTSRIIATSASCLAVTSNLYIGASGNTSYKLRVAGDTYIDGALQSKGQFSVRDSNDNAVAKIDQSGNILASGGITMYSDLRKKNILSDEVLSVKEIAAAPLFRHTYKSDDNQYIHVGTSAQYWSGIHEDWFTRKDSEGYYQMELQNLGVAMGISLAREIFKYESKTDKKIRLMKKRINELEARVKELEERRTA